MIRPRRVAAAVILLGLAAAGAAWQTGGEEPAALPAPPTAPPVSSATTEPTATTLAEETTVAPAPDGGSPLAALEAALEAWGRFAVTGDMTVVADLFAVEGPQWRRFQEEATAISADPPGGPAYRAWIERPQVEMAGDEAEVSGRVVFARTGEPSQVFYWTFVLRRSHGEWSVWTVAER